MFHPMINLTIIVGNYTYASDRERNTLDKYEYKIRADEIKDLIATGDYAQAADIVSRCREVDDREELRVHMNTSLKSDTIR